MLTLVHNWLRDARNGKWLVIIDNADDDQIFLKSEVARQVSQVADGRSQFSQPLSWYLPQTGNGRILMTTRYRDIALKPVEEHTLQRLRRHLGFSCGDHGLHGNQPPGTSWVDKRLGQAGIRRHLLNILTW